MKLSTWCIAPAVYGALLAVALFRPVQADEPTISLFNPPGVQRGTETEILITGVRLADSRELLIYPGSANAAHLPANRIAVTSLAAEGDSKVKVKLNVPADCPPGLYAVRMATETGISNLRYFGVSPMPQVEETEPNSDFAAPQSIQLNTTLNGVIKTEDVDYFAIDLTEGQRFTIELEGLRLGTEFFDPTIAILDENRFELVSSDDAPLLQQDCVCSLKAPKTGRYIIEVRESSFGGNDRCQYRLHIGDFPRPLAIVPAGGRPGELLDAKIFDASGESWQEKIQLPDAIGEFDYVSTRDGKTAPSANKLRVVDLPNVLEQEPEPEHAAITAVAAPVAFNGVLQEPGDVDWFKIVGKKDQQLDFTVYARRTLRSPVDSWLEIHKSSGGRLAANDDAGGPDSVQTFKFPEDGEYLIAIRDQLNEGSPIHAYRIEVAPAKQAVSLAIDELTRYFSQTVEVPQGAQMAVLLRAQRANFAGDLALRLERAPAGIELTTPTIAANQTYIPMLIKATKNAPIDADLSPLVAESQQENANVAGALDQRTMLVRGQNNRDMWGHNTDRLAIAVTKPMPFSLEVVQPQVPIVRNGSSNYIVRVQRNEGYKERIYLRSLYNPPGCSASGSIRIEADQNEALIPVTANASAGIGNYPITILARAKRDNSSVWVASEFINFEVADSFFDYKFGKTVAQTGAKANVLVALTVKRPPEGEVDFELLGLPAGVSSPNPKVKLSGDMTQISFPVEVAADARVGQFKSLVIKATITRPSGEIVQTQGTGEIQLAAPIANASIATNQPSESSSEKPLSRLEQLRQAKQLLQDAQP